MKLTWHGHSTFRLETQDAEGKTISVVIDPFFDDNPACSAKSDDVSADFILITHGHFDHVADATKIAERTGATCVAIYEIADWLATKHDVANTIGMNLGGKATLPFGSVSMVPAMHSSTLPDGTPGGVAAGFVVETGGKQVYFAGDTCLFSDMDLIGVRGIDLAVVPIGDLFTMGLVESVEAIKRLAPKQVVPCHYNTWPPIEQDAGAWAEMVKSETAAQPVVLPPGGSTVI